MRVYHVGLLKGTGPTRYWSNGHRTSTVVVEMRRDIDFLSTDLWEYLGERVTTKIQYKARKHEILGWINKQFKESFKHIIIN